jgi:hypothetical protein
MKAWLLSKRAKVPPQFLFHSCCFLLQVVA